MGISVKEIIDRFKLSILYGKEYVEEAMVNVPETSRPSFLLTGYYENFNEERIQILGIPEHSYIQQMEEEILEERWNYMLNQGIPCIITCRGLMLSRNILAICEKYKVPILVTEMNTSRMESELTRWLNVKLAPKVTVHGVLVDIYGEGVLILGDSGIGKSEAALELIRRGHRIVGDDSVEISKVSDETLVGRSSASTRNLLELRGIGIIDVQDLFGVECIKESQAISMIAHLEEWDNNKEYDRIGSQISYREILGNRVRCYEIPIKPGRNLAIILEAAAVNHRQFRVGRPAYEKLVERLK